MSGAANSVRLAMGWMEAFAGRARRKPFTRVDVQVLSASETVGKLRMGTADPDSENRGRPDGLVTGWMHDNVKENGSWCATAFMLIVENWDWREKGISMQRMILAAAVFCERMLSTRE